MASLIWIIKLGVQDFLLDYRPKDVQDEKSKKTTTNQTTKFQQLQQRWSSTIEDPGKDIPLFKEINSIGDNILTEHDVSGNRKILRTVLMKGGFSSWDWHTKFNRTKWRSLKNNFQIVSTVYVSWRNKSENSPNCKLHSKWPLNPLVLYCVLMLPNYSYIFWRFIKRALCYQVVSYVELNRVATLTTYTIGIYLLNATSYS